MHSDLYISPVVPENVSSFTDYLFTAVVKRLSLPVDSSSKVEGGVG